MSSFNNRHLWSEYTVVSGLPEAHVIPRLVAYPDVLNLLVDAIHLQQESNVVVNVSMLVPSSMYLSA